MAHFLINFRNDDGVDVYTIRVKANTFQNALTKGNEAFGRWLFYHQSGNVNEVRVRLIEQLNLELENGSNN